MTESTDELQLPVVEVIGSEARDLGVRVDPKTVATQLKAIRDEFSKALGQQQTQAGGFALKTVDVSLTVSASGSIGWVTASASGSISMHFEPV